MHPTTSTPEQGFAPATESSSPATPWLERLLALGGPDWRPHSRYVEVDGLPAHFIEQGTGKPVVLLHGFGAWAYSWRHNLAALAAQYRVFAVDLKGFGLSGRDRRQGHSLNDQARFVLGLLDKLGIARAALVGNSMGGEVSLRVALAAPTRVAGLGLVASSGTFQVRYVRWLRQAVRLPGFVRLLTRRLASRETVRRTLLEALGDPSLYRELDAEAYFLPLQRPHIEDVIAALARDADFGMTVDRLPEVQAPAIVIWGERDRFIPLAHGRALSERLRGSRFVVLPGLGHAPHEEKPDVVNALLLDFLAELAF